MATRSVNKTLNIPFGSIRLYADPRDQARAERLIANVPSILTLGYTRGTTKFGNQLLRMVKKCLSTGIPPRGVNWPKHSSSTIAKYGLHKLLNLTGQYARSVTIVKTKNRTFVGLPINVKKITPAGKPSRKTLNQIAILLEYGTRDGHLPARPLWKPAFNNLGGRQGLAKEIRNEIRKELRKYL